MDPAPLSDMLFYFEQGQSIASGTGYVSNGAVNGYVYPDFPAGTPTADRPVGYSAFLGILFWLFGPSVLVGTIANALLSAGGIAIFYLLSLRLKARRAPARIAALALVFFPNQIAYCGLLSDTVFLQFCIVLGAFLVTQSPRWPRVVVAGLVTGVVAMTRSYAALVPMFWAMLLWRKEGWRSFMPRFGILGLATALVVVPWTIRNYRAFGEVALVSTNFGHNLLAGHNDECRGQWVSKLPPPAYERGFENEVERDRALRKIAFVYMVEHPVRTVAMTVPKLFYMFAEDADGLRWTIKGRQLKTRVTEYRGGMVRYSPIDYVGMGVFQGYYLIVLCGFLGAVVLRAAGRLREFDPHGLGLWTIGIFAAISMIFFGMSRFHHPIVPFLTLYAAVFYSESSTWGGRVVATDRLLACKTPRTVKTAYRIAV